MRQRPGRARKDAREKPGSGQAVLFNRGATNPIHFAIARVSCARVATFCHEN